VPSARIGDAAEAAKPKASPAAPRPKPRSAFPDAHLPFLLSRITSMGTSSLIAIVEAVYAELKEHKVKKNAIEVKVREVGEKCKEKKVWVVKDEIKVPCSLPPHTILPLNATHLGSISTICRVTGRSLMRYC
jgi:chromatin assembly factor 1 subunit A